VKTENIIRPLKIEPAGKDKLKECKSKKDDFKFNGFPKEFKKPKINPNCKDDDI